MRLNTIYWWPLRVQLLPRGLPGVLHPQVWPHHCRGFQSIMATRDEVPHHILVASEGSMPRGLPGVLHPQVGPHHGRGFIMVTRDEVSHHISRWPLRVQCHEGYLLPGVLHPQGGSHHCRGFHTIMVTRGFRARKPPGRPGICTAAYAPSSFSARFPLQRKIVGRIELKFWHHQEKTAVFFIPMCIKKILFWYQNDNTPK